MGDRNRWLIRPGLAILMATGCGDGGGDGADEDAGKTAQADLVLSLPDPIEEVEPLTETGFLVTVENRGDAAASNIAGAPEVLDTPLASTVGSRGRAATALSRWSQMRPVRWT